MAEAKKQEGGKPAPKKGGGFKIIFLMTVLGCLMPFGGPTLLVCMGLLPTIVALFTDTDPRRSGVAAVGYMNIAGVLPYLLELWQKGQTMDVAMAMMRNPTTWVVMLGAAAIGQLFMYIVPPIVASVITINQESRLNTLQDGLKELEKIWGADVATQTSLDAVRRSRQGGG